MQFPLNINIDEREISTHLIAELLGMFIGFRYYLFLKKKTQDLLTSDERLKIFAAVCIGALIGSRLVGVLEIPQQLIDAPNKFVFIFSNKTIVGGLIGGLLSVELFKKIVNIKYSSGDLMTYPIVLGLIIGRIGCFCEGLSDGVIGSQTNLFTGIDFGDGIYRHPLPLYEIAFLCMLWIFIKWFETKYKLANGARFKLFMICYLLFRFVIEFIKDNAFTIGFLSTIQITTLVGLLYYYKTIFSLNKLIQNNA